MTKHKLDDLVRFFTEAYPVALGRPCVIPAAELHAALAQELAGMRTREDRLERILAAALDEAKTAGRAIEGMGFLRRFRLREEIDLRSRVRESLGYAPLEREAERPHPMEEEEILREFERHARVEEGRAENTVRSYAESIASYRAFLAARGMKLREATRADLLAWKESLLDRGNSTRTVNVRLAGVKALYRFMAVAKLGDRDPTQYVRFMPEQTKRMTILTPDEVDQMLGVIDMESPGGLRDYFLIAFLFATAGRIGEVTGLRVQDIDLRRGTVTFRGRKNKEDNVVCLTRESAELLRHYLQHVRPIFAAKAKDGYEDLVILSLHGRRFDRSNVSRTLKKYAKLAGIEKHVSSHTFRRSIATILANNGMPAELLKV
ncbi:tyrosine-type recombinase/integrase, partial [Planctomycetota bacterium]